MLKFIKLQEQSVFQIISLSHSDSDARTCQRETIAEFTVFENWVPVLEVPVTV